MHPQAQGAVCKNRVTKRRRRRNYETPSVPDRVRFCFNRDRGQFRYCAFGQNAAWADHFHDQLRRSPAMAGRQGRERSHAALRPGATSRTRPEPVPTGKNAINTTNYPLYNNSLLLFIYLALGITYTLS